jgi:hypothetical protein
MKRSVISLIILVFLVFSVGGLQSQAAEKTKQTNISYNKKAIKIKQLKKDFKKQWHEVLKNYPAVAIAFMYQEAALASLAYQRVDSVAESVGTYVSISDTLVASAVEISIHLTGCIDKLIMCDLRASSDGSVSVDEVHGCRNSFSNCWTRP